MKETLDSIFQAFKERTSNKFLGTFSLFFIIFNWQILYVMFFVDEKLIFIQTKLLANEYIYNNLFLTNSLLESLILVSHRFLIPFVLTYTFIWHLPKWILLPAYTEQEKYKNSRKRIRNELEKDIASLRNDILNLSQDARKIWNMDFEEFRFQHGDEYQSFVEKWYSGFTSTHSHQPNKVAYFDSIGLLNLSSNGENIESFTEKGKYFFERIVKRR